MAEEICRICGEPLDQDKSRCSVCNVIHNRKMMERAYAFKEKGLCVACRKPLDRETGWFCRDCLKITNAKAQNLRKLRRSQGLCPKCGKIPEQGYVQCLECRVKRAAQAAKDLQKKATIGRKK